LKGIYTMDKTKISRDLRLIFPLLSVGVCTSQPKTVRGDEVTVTYSIASRNFTLHEPVVLQLKVRNATSQAFQLSLGKNYNENFIVSFIGPGGATAQSRRIQVPGFGASGQVRVEPGETFEKNLLLNQWIEFDSPGKYEIDVRLAKAIETTGADSSVRMGSFHDTIEIAAEDGMRLNEVCAALARQLEMASSYQEAADAAQALSLVKDPIAIPYLERALFAKQLVEPIVIDSLERVGSDKAVQVLILALTRLPNDEIVLVRSSLERVRGKTSDPALKQEIERALAAGRTLDR
jgi:hypothetical protein